MINLHLAKNDSEIEAYVAVHSRREMVHNFDKMQFSKLSFNRTPTHYFQYQRIKIHSLPEPYETNCIDFQKKGFSSRQHCISDCRLKLQMENRTDQWPGNYFTDDSQSVRIMYNSFNEFQSDISKDQLFGDKCKQKCGTNTECYSEYYRLELKPFGVDYNNTDISVYPPDIPDLVYEYQPKVHFVEFVVFIAGSVSLWFGFSVLMLSNVILKLFTKINLHFNQYLKFNSVFAVNVYPVIDNNNGVKQIFK